MISKYPSRSKERSLLRCPCFDCLIGRLWFPAFLSIAHAENSCFPKRQQQLFRDILEDPSASPLHSLCCSLNPSPEWSRVFSKVWKLSPVDSCLNLEIMSQGMHTVKSHLLSQILFFVVGERLGIKHGDMGEKSALPLSLEPLNFL